MASKRAVAYAVALLTTISYSIWYIGSSIIVAPLRGTYSLIVPLFIIEVVSALLMFIFMQREPHDTDPRTLVYPIISGVMFMVTNFIFYFIISSTGISPASSFVSAEIVIFTLLLLLSSKNKMAMSFYYLGSVFVAVGLILESFKLSGTAVELNTTLIGEGLLLAVFAGVATYFYYLSTTKIGNKFTSMFIIQFTEVLLYGGIMLAVYKSIAFPTFTLPYTLLIVAVGAVLMLSFYFETTMMKLLIPLGKGAVSTGYILSDLQLLPVLAYVLIINPSSWVYYAPGLVIITIGMAFLEWK